MPADNTSCDQALLCRCAGALQCVLIIAACALSGCLYVGSTLAVATTSSGSSSGGGGGAAVPAPSVNAATVAVTIDSDANSNGVANPGDAILVVCDATGNDSSALEGASFLADLSAMGGPASVVLLDDGLNGDATANDAKYAVRFVLTAAAIDSAAVTVRVWSKSSTGAASESVQSVATVSVDTGVPAVSLASMTLLITTDTEQAGTINAGDSVTFAWSALTSGVTDAQAVVADLSAFGLGSSVALRDDGLSGDLFAGDGLFSYTANFTTGTMQRRTPTWSLVVTDNAGNVSSAQSDDNSLQLDTKPPSAIGAESLDLNSNGKWDAARLVFDEPVKDSTFGASGWRIGGWSCVAMDTDGAADDDRVVILLSSEDEFTAAELPQVTFTPGLVEDLAGHDLAAIGNDDLSEEDHADPQITLAYAEDGTSRVAGVDAGDFVRITFSEVTNGATLTAQNVDTALALSSGFSWLDGSGQLGGAVWSDTNTTLTLTLSTDGGAPTVDVGTVITPDGATIRDTLGNPLTATAVITGDFLQAKPTITAVSTDIVRVGILVTITGTAFSTELTNNVVTFAGAGAEVTTASPTALTVSVTAVPAAGDLVVSIAGMASDGSAFGLAPQQVSVDYQGNDVLLSHGWWGPSVSDDGRYVAFWSRNAPMVSSYAVGVDVFVRDRLNNTNEIVSTGPNGVYGDETGSNNRLTAMSGDGRYVAFASRHSNLVPNDNNGGGGPDFSGRDVFVRDRETSTTSRVSVASDGTEGNDEANDRVEISRDGRYVVFSSKATNMVSGDANGVSDVFVHDRNTATTTRISVSSDGTEGNYASGNASGSQTEMSDDGRYVVFESEASNLVSGDVNIKMDIFVRDRTASTTTRITPAGSNDSSFHPTVSGDGRFVAYSSSATNIVSGDTNGMTDVFLNDRTAGTTVRVSVLPDGTQGDGSCLRPKISGDGRFVAFDTNARTLIPGKTAHGGDIMVYDVLTKTLKVVSVTNAGALVDIGTQSDPAISLDGRFIVFESWAGELVLPNGAADQKRVFITPR